MHDNDVICIMLRKVINTQHLNVIKLSYIIFLNVRRFYIFECLTLFQKSYETQLITPYTL